MSGVNGTNGIAGAVTPVVLCGGAGTRLWPSSRASRPKQFIPLVGETSTFQAAVQRVAGAPGFSRPIVIANQDHRFIVAEQLAELSVEADIVLEPERRDSAAAVATAAVYAAGRSPGSVVLTLAADHVIGDDEGFQASVASAASVAQGGYIMTLGVVPTEPSTAYGYIQPGKPIANSGAFEVNRFVEKPSAEAAQEHIKDGHLWNSGNFLFRPDVMMEEFERLAPAILSSARDAVGKAGRDLDFIRLDADAHRAAPATSIDYAVMERTARAAVMPVRFPWSDVGSWGALWSVSPQDSMGNAVRGQVELANTRNSLVHSPHMLTAVVGLDDVVVVAEPDAVLVTSRARSGDVKDLIAALRRKRRSEADEHLRTDRPWGWYQRVDLGSRFQVKRICVKPGGRLSLQKHFHRAEHWIVVRGTAEVQVDERRLTAFENEAVYLPIGCVHRLCNPGRIPLELIEVQVGSYTGEDDIVRLEDVYGR